MNAQLFLTLGLLGILLQSTGCAGLSGFARRTGPVYEAEVQSWHQVIQEKGGNGNGELHCSEIQRRVTLLDWPKA